MTEIIITNPHGIALPDKRPLDYAVRDAFARLRIQAHETYDPSTDRMIFRVEGLENPKLTVLKEAFMECPNEIQNRFVSWLQGK